jgi:hypothetical protein
LAACSQLLTNSLYCRSNFFLSSRSRKPSSNSSSSRHLPVCPAHPCCRKTVLLPSKPLTLLLLLLLLTCPVTWRH